MKRIRSINEFKKEFKRESKKEQGRSFTEELRIISNWLCSRDLNFARDLDLEPRMQMRGYINHKSDTVGRRLLISVREYLLEKRGGYNNDLNFLALDYFEVVFGYYAKANRLPYPNQLMPTPENDMRFDDYINEVEEGEFYWTYSTETYEQVHERVQKTILIGKEKIAFMHHKIQLNIRAEKENRPELFQVIYPETDDEFRDRVNAGDMYFLKQDKCKELLDEI